MKRTRFVPMIVIVVIILLFGMNRLCRADDLLLGQQAEQAGKLRQGMTYYIEALKSDGSNQQLREKIIKLAQKIQPPLSLTEMAERHMARGGAAVKAAKDKNGYIRAADEFSHALLAAPWYADGYYNLGIVQDRAGLYVEAINNLQMYLLASPEAPDRKKVKTFIYEIEYRRDETRRIDAEVKRSKEEEASKITKFSGTWRNFLHTVTLEADSSGCLIKYSGVGEGNMTNQVRKADGCKIVGNRLQIELRGYGGGAYPFSYSVLCEHALSEDGNELKGKYISGEGTSKLPMICEAYKFKRVP